LVDELLKRNDTDINGADDAIYSPLRRAIKRKNNYAFDELLKKKNIDINRSIRTYSHQYKRLKVKIIMLSTRCSKEVSWTLILKDLPKKCLYGMLLDMGIDIR